jgi:tRNA (guanine6-N2)-methyltransferase
MAALSAVAFATKGLEDVTAGEIREILGAGSVVSTGTKHVLFTASGDPVALRRLATADDVCLLLAAPLSVATPEDLDRALSGGADFPAVLDAVAALRPPDGTFSVTVTAARSPLGGGAAVAEVAAGAVARRLGWSVRQRERAPVDLRVFLDGRSALLGVRLFDAPLSQRAYRTVDLMGSLRPTVAAAMVRLAGADGPREVWDPFCGSGTVLAESAAAGHRVSGTDLDPAAVAAARANLAAIDERLATRVEPGDSASLATWRRHGDADTVLTNMPWGKQVAVRDAARLYDVLGAGLAGVLARGGRAGVLTVEPDRLVAAVRRAAPDRAMVRAQRRRIGLLGQSPTLVSFGVPGSSTRQAPAAG